MEPIHVYADDVARQVGATYPVNCTYKYHLSSAKKKLILLIFSNVTELSKLVFSPQILSCYALGTELFSNIVASQGTARF